MSDQPDYLKDSGKNSMCGGSTSSDVSDESMCTSLSNSISKPHKVNDIRWEAIQAVRARDGSDPDSAPEKNYFGLILRERERYCSLWTIPSFPLYIAIWRQTQQVLLFGDGVLSWERLAYSQTATAGEVLPRAGCKILCGRGASSYGVATHAWCHYRDLKPENVLVREDGHIMLSDVDLSLRCAVSPTLVKTSSLDTDPSMK